MNQITEQPNQYDFGHEFNYAVWPIDSRITLLNTRFNNDYSNIVNYVTQANFNRWIDSQPDTMTITNVSLVKFNTPVKLDIPFNAALKYNYMRVSNPLQPVNGDVKRDYYYFILDVIYISPETTQFVLQLDYWQSFGYEVEFGSAYLEQGHYGIAASNAFNAHGRDYLTEPEGFDLGAETQIVWQRTKPLLYLLAGDNTDYGPAYLIVSTTQINADPGTTTDPKLRTATGSMVGGSPGGADHYIVRSKNDVVNLFSRLADYPWVTQGILGVYVIPNPERYVNGFSEVNISSDSPLNGHVKLWRSNSFMNGNMPLRYSSFVSNFRDSKDVTPIIPDRYRHLKKFFTAPYMWIELTNGDGRSIILRPEFIDSDDLGINEGYAPSFTGGQMIIAPYRYNYYEGWGETIDGRTPGVPNDNTGRNVNMQKLLSEGLANAIVIDNLPQSAVVNNNAILARANQAHSLQQQRTNLDWSQDKALAANQLSYDQATAGMNLSTGLTGVSNAAANAQTGVANQAATNSAIIGGAGSLVGGLMSGGLGGLAGGALSAASGALNTANQINARNQSTAISTGAASASTAMQVANTGYLRDTNKNLADWAARGDYSASIGALNAKVQDMRLTPPGQAGSYSGDTLMTSFDAIRAIINVRTIPSSVIGQIGEYWLRFGYRTNRFITMPKSLMTMNKFTYWKMKEVFIVNGGMPESVKQIIRGIFEKGVTVWAKDEYIGTTDFGDNKPLSGIRF